MWFYVALVACWRLWGPCGARMFDCVASIGGIARAAAAAVAAQHDHFDKFRLHAYLAILMVSHCNGSEYIPYALLGGR